jgi:hypothetical protein
MKEVSKSLSISERDYNALAGSDWPSYDNFIQHYNVPSFVYKEINEKINDKNNSIFISTHDENDDLLFERFLIKIKEQDRLKNIRMQDYVPEFYELINEYVNRR